MKIWRYGLFNKAIIEEKRKNNFFSKVERREKLFKRWDEKINEIDGEISEVNKELKEIDKELKEFKKVEKKLLKRLKAFYFNRKNRENGSVLTPEELEKILSEDSPFKVRNMSSLKEFIGFYKELMNAKDEELEEFYRNYGIDTSSIKSFANSSCKFFSNYLRKIYGIPELKEKRKKLIERVRKLRENKERLKKYKKIIKEKVREEEKYYRELIKNKLEKLEEQINRDSFYNSLKSLISASTEEDKGYLDDLFKTYRQTFFQNGLGLKIQEKNPYHSILFGSSGKIGIVQEFYKKVSNISENDEKNRNFGLLLYYLIKEKQIL